MTCEDAPLSSPSLSLRCCSVRVPETEAGFRGAVRADERLRGREKDGGEGRGETPVAGRAVHCPLRGFGLRKIRQRHRQHQRGEGRICLSVRC